MKSFIDVLVDCDTKLRSFLKENSDLMDVPSGSSVLCNCVVVLKDEYTIEFENWLRQKEILSKFEEIELKTRKKLKDERFLSKFDLKTGKLELKKGVLTFGTFSSKNIHSLMSKFGLRESDAGYYVVALLMNSPERKEILMLSEILEDY